MKKAGFNLVRMGDLSWDSFEPSEGRFEFAWFDKVMDEMAANGIKVILDIPGQPAPTWLHHKYPGVNLVTQNRTMFHPAERYMQDIGDPDYRRLAARMADQLTKHDAHHPALLAVGYDNEIGNSYMSYSSADRLRFIDWLKAKYGTVEALNKAWATQRWSRRINEWDEVELPYGDGPGPAERYLDLRRFWSDQTIAALKELEVVRKQNVPNAPAVSNLWDTARSKPFDYLSSYKDNVSYGAEGFYPGEPVGASLGALMIKGDLDTPIWFNEFTAGGGGDYATRGRSRMWAYLGLIDYAQTVLAWTFNSHLGGEEQALFGLVDHDNTPSWKGDEFAQIAKEFQKLEKLGFPRYRQPDVAIAHPFDNAMVTSTPGQHPTVTQYYKLGYMDQVQGAFEPFFTDNIDTAIVNLAYVPLDKYRLGGSGPIFDGREERSRHPPLCRERGHGDHDRLFRQDRRARPMVRHAPARPPRGCLRVAHQRLLSCRQAAAGEDRRQTSNCKRTATTKSWNPAPPRRRPISQTRLRNPRP